MKADEPQVGQQYEDVERKREYYHIIFSEVLLHQERREQVKTLVMEHFTYIPFHESGPANKQHTNETVNQL